MKRILIATLFSAATLLGNAQGTKAKTTVKTPVTNAANAATITVMTYNSVNHEMGNPMTVFPQNEFGGVQVYWKINVNNFKAIKAKYRLEIKVYKVQNGEESISYKNAMDIPTRNGWQFLFSEFTEGTYVIYVRDQDNLDDVYSKTTFTVLPHVTPDYKHNSTLTVCKSVDDNWNAVGGTSKVKAGECMNFLYKAKDKVGYAVMRWNVVKVNADGNEDYVTHLDQGTTGKPFRYLATTDGVCVFTTPGTYRVYLFRVDDYDTSIQRGEESKFIGKAEITVY